MIQCPVCQKQVRGPSQMRIHMTSHEGSAFSQSPSNQPTNPTQPQSIPQLSTPMAPSQSSSLSALDAMKQQIANSNEILMLMSTNKMLRDSMSEKPHQTSVQQPSTVNDFLTQFNQMRQFEEETKRRILEDLPEDDDDDDDEIDGMMKQLLTPMLNGNTQPGKTQFGDPQTPTAEAQIDQALSE